MVFASVLFSLSSKKEIVIIKLISPSVELLLETAFRTIAVTIFYFSTVLKDVHIHLRCGFSMPHLSWVNAPVRMTKVSQLNRLNRSNWKKRDVNLNDRPGKIRKQL